MNRAELALERVSLGLVDMLHQTGGIDLVGFYLALASYQDGQAGDGRLIFDTISGAITTLGMSRERYYKLKSRLEDLGLYEARAGRIYLRQAPSVRMPNHVDRNPNKSVRTPNAVMSLSQEEDVPLSSTDVGDAGSDRWEVSPELAAIIAEAESREFFRISGPQTAELSRLLDEQDPDLVVYAIEIMDGYGRRSWGPVLNQCRRWLDNLITTRAGAVEDHSARRSLLEAHRRDFRQEAPATAREFYDRVRARLEAGKTTVAREIGYLHVIRPAAYVPSLTIKRRRELILLAEWSVRTGRVAAI